ncbi:MAG: aryl-sulfate sulfotransferase [Kiritimatiellia bacterium]
MKTVYPVGTTLYKPDKCFNGYTLLFNKLDVKLIDMNGRTAHSWELDTELYEYGTSRTHLLDNGHIIALRGSMTSNDGVIDEYDWDGNLVWRYIPEGKIPHTRLLGPHHDVWRKQNGNTLLICREAVPEKYLKEVRNPLWQNQEICGDTILEVNPDGETVWEWQSHGHLDINHYRLLASPDWFAGPYNSTVVDWTQKQRPGQGVCSQHGPTVGHDQEG